MPSLQRLPKGFRYLLTLKEIKQLELDAGLKFERISNGNITSAKRFEPAAFFQSSFSGPSVDGFQREGTWHFSIHQSGFRVELLLNEFEDIVKREVAVGIVAFLRQVVASTSTDFVQKPYKRALIFIKNNKASVSWLELMHS